MWRKCHNRSVHMLWLITATCRQVMMAGCVRQSGLSPLLEFVECKILLLSIIGK